MAESASNASDIAAILADYIPRAEHEQLLDSLNQVLEERDTHKAAAEQHTARLAELEKTVRGRTYRDAFNKLAKDAKVKDEHADDVFELLKLEQDADEPDEKAIGKQLSKFLESRKHLIESAEEKPKKIPAGEGSERGRSTALTEPEFRVSQRESNDAVWMRRNGDAFRQAAKAGTLVLDED